MLKLIAPLLLLLVSSELFAAPVLFTAAEYSVDVVAGVDAASAADSATVTTPPDDPLLDLPAIASAIQDGANLGDDAAADALADNVFGELLLSASTEAGSESAGGAFADASAASSLFATFAGAGLYTLMLDFESLSESLVAGINDAGAQLFVRIDAGVDTLLDRSLTLDELLSFDFILPDAVEGVLDVVLVGSAFAETGRAANLATAAFSLDVVAVANNVSEAPTLALLMAALLMVVTSSRGHRCSIGFAGRYLRSTTRAL